MAIPDVRGWTIIGFFGLTYAILAMIYFHPEFLKDADFMQFSQTLATGGILLIASNLFGGTKSGAETNKALAEGVAKALPPGTGQ